MDDKTIEYYNKNAQNYFDSTVNAEIDLYDMFLQYLNKRSYILDFGCGSGRDTKYFLQKGYKVKSIDGSKELCSLASNYTKSDVICMNFLDFKEENTFDGVWAMASLLHLDKKELLKVLERIYNSLKNGGVLYMSFKDGSFSEYNDTGRYYSYYTLHELINLTTNIMKFKLLEYKNTISVINPNESRKWHNLVLKKEFYGKEI